MKEGEQFVALFQLIKKKRRKITGIFLLYVVIDTALSVAQPQNYR